MDNPLSPGKANDSVKSKGNIIELSREPTVTRSEVTVTQLPTQPRDKTATQTVTISNSFASAPAGNFSFGTMNGAVSFSTVAQPHYQIVITLTAETTGLLKDPTDVINAIRISTRDILSAYEKSNESVGLSFDCNVSGPQDEDWGAAIDVLVPNQPEYALTIQTTNGDIHVDCACSNAALKTANGRIELLTAPNHSGKFTIATSNGEVAVTVPVTPVYGYDLEAGTVNGEIKINLPDIERIVDEPTTKHIKTNGFDTRDIRLIVQLTTSNADIKVN